MPDVIQFVVPSNQRHPTRNLRRRSRWHAVRSPLESVVSLNYFFHLQVADKLPKVAWLVSKMGRLTAGCNMSHCMQSSEIQDCRGQKNGHAIPEPSSPGITYAHYLEELSVKDPQAFLCHFYNVYFAHSAGGRMIGKKVAEKVINNKELEFFKWDGDLSQLLQNVRERLNEVAEACLLRAGLGRRRIIAWNNQKNHSSTLERSCVKKFRILCGILL